MKLFDLSTESIENRIRNLAKKYVPEWQFDYDRDTKNADIGGAIARIFALQMMENVDMLNRMPERYHAEFVNMLDISQRPAQAAGSMVVFSLIDGTVPGTKIVKGTRLVADTTTENGDSIYFETEREIYVTGARITDAFMTDREEGSLVPLLGDFTPDPLIDGIEVRDEEEEESFTEDEPEVTEEEDVYLHRIRPFVLFSETGDISGNVLILYHDFIFDQEDEPIYIRITGNEAFNRQIEAGNYRFRYFSKRGISDFDEVKLLSDGETFLLKKSRPNRRFLSGNREYSVVVLERISGKREETMVSGLSLSSSGGERPLEYVTDGMSEFSQNRFLPFTDTLSVYNECYLGHNLYFSRAGAEITLRFKVSYPEKTLSLSRREEDAELKIIKRKPKSIASEVPAEAYADEIGLEYFNGTGWKRLRCKEDYSRIFADGQACEVTLSFICPSDWEETQSGAFTGRAIRMRLMASENCYLRPCIHHYPAISEPTVRFSYEGSFVSPKRVQLLSGTRRRDITSALKKAENAGDGFSVMSSGEYRDDALYLGFDKPLADGPVSLYFELDDVVNQRSLQCVFEYSTMSGFKRLRILDQTLSFSRSGAVFFIPPSDMHELSIEQKRRYWIRIRRKQTQHDGESRLFLPRIRRILLNVVNVKNIVTLPEQNYYLSETEPDQRVSLPPGHILKAEVWVNETGSLSREEINTLLTERPEDIRIEWDIFGGVSSAFVRWEETESFLNVPSRRCYLLDRVTNEIVFSDGLSADVPRVTDDVSFKVTLLTTDGETGNIGAEHINETAGTELYIDQVTNPVRAYGGSDMETVEEALKRGASILYGRGRLVSVRDYINDILGFSKSIAKAACVLGDLIGGGHNDAAISFVLLMRDYKEGSFSFHRVAGSLREHLLQSSSVTVADEQLYIVEPIFIRLSVSIWAEVISYDDTFEVQSLITELLTRYLDPIEGDGGSGWEIGTIPKPSQIRMKLAGLVSYAVITKSVMTVQYTDAGGEHEMDLSDLKASPFMTVRPDNIRVNITVRE
ncbi:MAG: hypothetical protein IJT16_09540 [Lachnospiraceae bacterium]|nr:hypothetical protein [Lachnospiraceae bacterium]